MWWIFGICAVTFFAGFIYLCLDQFYADNNRMVRHVDSGGYRPSSSPVRKWDGKLGSLASLHLPEDNDNGRKES